MSKNLERVIQRAISDAAFRRQLQSNPEAALRGFKLTDSEVAALRSGDAGKLTSLGIDQRMSKTFAFGGDSLASRASIGGDLTTGSGSAYTGDVSGARNASVDGENTSGAVNAADADSTSGATRVIIPGSAGGTTAAFDPGFVNDSSSVGDPMADTSGASVIADPDNPAYARGYIGGQAAPTSDALEDQSHSFAATRSADVAGSARPSIIGDPDNPVNARGYIGEQGAGSATTSNIGDPDNPASARTFTGGQTASASDAIEDQGHAFAATRDQGASGASASNIGDPDNPASARTFTGGQTASASDAIEDQGHAFAATRSADLGTSQAAPVAGSPEEYAFRDQSASGVSASNIGDPDNPASARTFTGGQTASASEAIEDQSHAFGATRSADLGTAQAAPVEGSPEEFAFRDQGASAVTASNIGDPDNPAVARGYTGGESAPTSDALEDQSHAIAASRSDAFLSEGEVSQYSDPSLSTGQAVDEGELFNANASLPDDADAGTATQHHEPDVPS